MWLLLASAPACAQEVEPETVPPPPGIVELARGFRPVPVEELAARWDAAEGVLSGSRPADGGHGWRIEHAFARGDWQARATEHGELWFAPLPRGAALRADRCRARVRLGTTEWARAPRFGFLRPGGFLMEEDGVLVRSFDALPPAEAVLELSLASGQEVEGLWNVEVGEFSGVGLPVWSGERETVVVDVPPASTLLCTLRHTAADEQHPAVFRVRLGAEVLAEKRCTTRVEREWLVLDLPAAGVARAALVFEVEGPPGLGCFAGPVLAPRARGDYRSRPWAAARPNVVLFLADTFRADNLAACGGASEDAPNLNRLAAESVCFVEARSSASWTLPSLSALLTGCYPVQVGVRAASYRMPEEVDTLAEHFARAGYRTGAVTDAVYFSPTYGLHQGFGWFRPREFESWSLDGSLEDARSFLAGDDGRPVFLVLHTYRAHDPYRTGREESASEWKALKAETLAELDPKERARGGVGLAKRERALALYRAGVRALDERFGAFRGLLEEQGVLARGYLAFTADHGEAFGENGVMRHGGSLWDSRIRVPLLVHGPDLAPRQVSWTVSNIDLAPTLGALAGLAPDPRWPGQTLLGADGDRSVFAFRLNNEEIAVVEGHRKLLAGLEELERGRAGKAFDLGLDRGEKQNLSTAEWATELAQRSAPRVRALIEQGIQGGSAELDANELRTLEELGYAGEH